MSADRNLEQEPRPSEHELACRLRGLSWPAAPAHLRHAGGAPLGRSGTGERLPPAWPVLPDGADPAARARGGRARSGLRR